MLEKFFEFLPALSIDMVTLTTVQAGTFSHASTAIGSLWTWIDAKESLKSGFALTLASGVVTCSVAYEKKKLSFLLINCSFELRVVCKTGNEIKVL